MVKGLNMEPRSLPKTKALFKLGDRVRFKVSNSYFEGIVTEDSGPIAGNGRHLLAVTVKAMPDEPDLVFQFRDNELADANELIATSN